MRHDSALPGRVIPGIYGVVAMVSFLPYTVPVNSALMATTALLSAAFTAWIRQRSSSEPNPLSLPLQILAITVIVSASGGSRSPVRGLFLLYVLQAGVRNGGMYGLAAGFVAVIGIAVSDAACAGLIHIATSRVVDVAPFYLLTGYVTGVLADERAASTFYRERTERELSVAREIQKALLPERVPSPPAWKIEWRLKPHFAVGGDLVSFLELGPVTRCLVADVCGKGVSAALLVGTIHQLFHSTGHLKLSEAMGEVNRYLCHNTPTALSVTMVLIELDHQSNTIRCCNAGHPYPILWNAASRKVEQWTDNDASCGWLDDTSFHVEERVLAQGDRLLIYTDGVSDAITGGDERLEVDGVIALLRHAMDCDVTETADRLLTAACANQADDVTLLLAECVGADAAR